LLSALFYSFFKIIQQVVVVFGMDIPIESL